MFDGYAKSAISDAYYRHVIVHYHANAANGAALDNLIDSSPYNATITSYTPSGFRKGMQISDSPHGNGNPAFRFISNYYSDIYNGENQFSFADHASLQFGTGDFTIELWIKTQVSLYNDRTQNFLVKNGSFKLYVGIEGFAGLEFRGVNRSGYSSPWPSQNTLWDGNWHHIALSRNSGNVKFFVDGVIQHSFVDSGDASGSGNSLKIGESGTATNFDGFLSCIRIVKGTSIYNAAFSPPKNVLTAVSGTSLLTLHHGFIFDGSPNNHAPVYEFSGNIPIKRPLFIGSGPFSKTTYSISNRGGSFQIGKSSITFNGSFYVQNDISRYTATIPTIGTSDFTFEFWVKGRAEEIYAGGSTLFSIGNSLVFYINGDMLDAKVVGAADLFAPFNGYYANVGYAIFYWTHFALVRQGSSIKFYQNGKLVASTTADPSVANITATTLKIGSNSGNSGGIGSNIRLSDIRITTTALYTSDFVIPTTPLASIANTIFLCKCQNAPWFDMAGSTEGQNFDTISTISTSQYKFGSSSFKIGGSDGGGFFWFGNDSSKSPNNLFFSSLDSWNYSIEFWIKFNTLNLPTGFNYYIWSTGRQFNQKGETLLVSVYNGAFRLSLYCDNTTTYSSVSLGTTDWYHIAVCRAGQKIKVFLNGIETLSGTFAQSSAHFNYYGFGLCKPGVSNYSDYVQPDCYLDEIRITNNIVRYWSNFTPPSAEFLDYGNHTYPVSYGQLEFIPDIEYYAPYTKVWTFLVPQNVTSISAFLVGGGGDGYMCGGGGGGTAYGILSVTPGESLTVQAGGKGVESYIKRGTTYLLRADGGGNASGTSAGSGGSYGLYSATSAGGGNGGAGICGYINGNLLGGAGGGAAGYGGNGGSNSTSATNGGGNGSNDVGGTQENYSNNNCGDSWTWRGGGGGGGVGLHGQGLTNGYGGEGGIGSWSPSHYQYCGGGAGGASYNHIQDESDPCPDAYDSLGGITNGASAGAVRIIWGDGRFYPSTNTYDILI